jgi:hypothetical protein
MSENTETEETSEKKTPGGIELEISVIKQLSRQLDRLSTAQQRLRVLSYVADSVRETVEPTDTIRPVAPEQLELEPPKAMKGRWGDL